ncbi:MAG: signal recognition particle-docking protein FtsY [Candidatus Hadarchaeales archaeon]
MFDKLKKKLGKIKQAIAQKIASKPEEPVEEAPVEEKLETPPVEQPRPEAVLPPEPVEPEMAAPKEVAAPPPSVEKPLEEKPALLPPEKPAKFVKRELKRIFGRKLSPEDIEDIIWELQVTLLESDVAVNVADHIISSVKKELALRRIGPREDPKEVASDVLRKAIKDVLTIGGRLDIFEVIEKKKEAGEPAVIVFLGINGHGKTTTIAKMAKLLKDRGYRVVLAAADTFRAAAIEQLEIHARRVGVELVKQKRGADAAAVAYDAIAHAKAKGGHVVLVDTAGRMQTNENLMDEMKKIVRVAKPDLVIFVGDALTGNDAVEQAKAFNDAVGINGSILCKMDADARGGAALSIAHVTGRPIIYIGTGQGYDDLEEFDPEKIANLLLGD